MAEDSQSAEQPPQGSVFGNLPDARPGTRSPRRRSGGAQDKAEAPPKAKPKPKPKPAKAPPAEPKPPEASAPAARGEGGGIEDLAWAGVAAAAEAATLGVRIASRALDALRGNSERD